MITYTRTAGYDKNGNPEKVVSTIGVGTTLYITCESEQVMSDMWEMMTKAYYWDRVAKTIKSAYVDNGDVAVVDANVSEFESEIFTKNYNALLEKYNTEAEYDSKNPAMRGRKVVVTAGRGKDKTNVGKIGTVAVVKDMMYGMGYRSVLRPKLGIALSDVKEAFVAPNGKTYMNHKDIIWVWAHNCEVVNPVVEPAVIEDNERRAVVGANSEVERIRYRCKNTLKNINDPYKEAA